MFVILVIHGLQNSQVFKAHNSYHACEVISIRHMLGLWLDRT